MRVIFDMRNYPDDIRQYDNDQRSPFYEGEDTTVKQENMVARILDTPDLTSEMMADVVLEDKWLEFSNSMRDIVNGKDTGEALAVIRQIWLSSAKEFAEGKDYAEVMGFYLDDSE